MATPTSAGRAAPWLSLLTLLAAACGGDPLGQDARLLVGEWGSTEAELIGISSGAELRMDCVTLIIDVPIALADDNTFGARARVDGPGLTLGDLPVVSLAGKAANNRVSITVPAQSGNPSTILVLEGGVHRPASDLPQCPL